MDPRNFQELVRAQWAKRKFVSVGLDFDQKRLPEHLRHEKVGIAAPVFSAGIVDTTKDIACIYKPNLAFYLRHGDEGVAALRIIITYIRAVAPDNPVLLDFKEGDIGNTNLGYVEAAFDYFNADAVTVEPYLGIGALKPFLDRADKGIFVVCRTSNPEAHEFQDLLVSRDGSRPLEPLFVDVARRVAHVWNGNGNCGLVAGATYPQDLARVRETAGDDVPILIPAIGAQGGDLQKSVVAGKNSRNDGFIINASRSIIYASSGTDFAEASRRETLKLHDAINACLGGP